MIQIITKFHINTKILYSFNYLYWEGTSSIRYHKYDKSTIVNFNKKGMKHGFNVSDLAYGCLWDKCNWIHGKEYGLQTEYFKSSLISELL